jgi:CRP-like cAMP-binding protein
MQYRAGSLIYFHGDPAERVFILQSGKVNLRYQNIETGEDIRDVVQPGEFFGVKSALGRYPREENAIAMQDTVAMAFTVPEFEALAAANTRIIMKMLKVFSNQMRRIHAQVSSLLTKEGQQNPEDGLFTLGQFYFKNRRFSQAKYIFSRYLTYYPAGQYAQKAVADLKTSELSILRAGGGTPAASSAASTPAGAATPPASSAAAMSETAKAYYEAVSLISQQKHQMAYLAFKKIADDRTDPEFAVKGSFEVGHCLFLLNKYDECIKHYTMMLTKYPKYPDLTDALFYMGQAYEKINNKYQAAVFYKKILSMPDSNQDGGVHAKATQALKALGV